MISSIIKKKLTAELEELTEELKAAAIQVDETSADGDFRENDNASIAKAKYTEISDKIIKIKTKLEEPVEDPIGSVITEGKLLEIEYLGIIDSKNVITEPASEKMILLFSDEGDPVVEGVLSSKCDLGRLISNGREGSYSVSAGNISRLYNVSIFKGNPDEYFKRYPASKRKKLEMLLGGEIY